MTEEADRHGARVDARWTDGTGIEVAMRKYEYKFVRLGEGWFSARKEAKREYQEVIERHARDGWRLVQVFAPGIGGYGSAKYYEIILEREV